MITSRRILNYNIESVIGEGGMGTVFLGKHMTLDRKVAIKVLLPEFANNSQIRDRFINEAKTLSKLNHQNIVTLYDFADQDNNLFLIMEFVEGNSLDKVIEQITGAIPEPRCIAIFKQILSGFSYAHKKGIIHRDIKPSNIILQADDAPKILDFGIAKIVEGDVRLTKTGTRMGSVVYMSPEQVMGREVDQRSDIYSLGVTLYEMLAGRLPYDTTTESEFEIQTKIVREPLEPVRSMNLMVSEELDQIICTATAKEPEYRFQSCDEFKDALTGTISLEQVTKTVINQSAYKSTVIQSPVYQLQDRVTFKKRNTSLFIGLGLAIIAAIIIIFFFLNKAEEPVVSIKQTEQTTKTPVPVPTSAAVEIVKGFITDLGNRDFYSAYQRQKNDAWGDYDFFSSTKSFGGINRTVINDISLYYENPSEASVYVDYHSYDPANKNGRYKQDFRLKKFGGEWKIVKVKNISVEQW